LVGHWALVGHSLFQQVGGAFVITAMSDWSFLERPAGARTDADFQSWFADMANHLLNGCRLIAGGQPHRFTEIEFYYRSADHTDPFPHADPIQRHQGLWYFHKTRGEYRGGSYKGVDLTFGHDQATGGILIRGIETPDGVLVDGPSLTVDYLLAKTGHVGVRELDIAIAGRPGWVEGNPLGLLQSPELAAKRIYRSARVGLSLRAATRQPQAAPFVMKPYRFLTQPKRIKKGKTLLILELHVEGRSDDEIREITGSPMKSIRAAIEESEAGRAYPSFEEFIGADLTPRTLCRLHGAWQTIYGKGETPRRPRDLFS
jgi:hypothetical protein